VIRPAQTVEGEQFVFSDSSLLYQELCGAMTVDELETSVAVSGAFGYSVEVSFACYKKGCRRTVALFAVADKTRREACETAYKLLRKVTTTCSFVSVVCVFNKSLSRCRIKTSFVCIMEFVCLAVVMRLRKITWFFGVFVSFLFFVFSFERGAASLSEAILASRSWSEPVVAHVGKQVRVFFVFFLFSCLVQIAAALGALHGVGIVFGALSPLCVLVSGEQPCISPLDAFPLVRLAFSDAVRPVGPLPARPAAAPVFQGPFAAPDTVASPACDM
jgi:hypothetical protein